MSNAYPHIVPDIEKWPINKLSMHRRAFVEEMNAFTLNKFTEKNPEDIESIIASTIYKEKLRVKTNPWKVDPGNEKQYWKKLEIALKKSAQSERKEEENIEILKRIINRYSEEIVGNFNPKTFRFARKFLTSFFKRILLRIKGYNPFRLWGGRERLLKNLKVQGHVEEVRALFDKGTVVFLPTHFSNLDSILIGYAIDSKVGLPFTSYGAGLNLFDVEIVAYFINRLGAYRVDRRKKNAIYLESLKTYSCLSIQRGINSLFFPGGTRSRNGMIEKNVKLGLLNTLLQAQRRMIREELGKKIIVVPLTLGYHGVLEASSLIEQHLVRSGKERYLRSKKRYSFARKLMHYFREILFRETEIVINVGQPLDVFGNELNTKGDSVDRRGNTIDIHDYFKMDGQLLTNEQRERVYTKNLGDRLVERYHTENVVLSSHLVAFVCFKFLEKANRELDLYSLLGLPTDSFAVDEKGLYEGVANALSILEEKALANQLILSDILKEGNIAAIIADGIHHLESYHIRKPIIKNKNGTYGSQDFKLLYYYHNRLLGYQLEELLNIDATKAIAVIE